MGKELELDFYTINFNKKIPAMVPQPAFFYHIVTPMQWAIYADKLYYEAPSLHTEGFIHSSTAAQVAATLNRYYIGEPVVLLLKIEAAKLNAPVKYELAPSVNEYFPHIYGQLNKDAIVEITKVPALANGSFSLEQIPL